MLKRFCPVTVFKPAVSTAHETRLKRHWDVKPVAPAGAEQEDHQPQKQKVEESDTQDQTTEHVTHPLSHIQEMIRYLHTHKRIPYT